MSPAGKLPRGMNPYTGKGLEHDPLKLLAKKVSRLEQRVAKLEKLTPGVRNETLDSLAELAESGICVFGWEGEARCLEDPDVAPEDYCVLCTLREEIQRG